MSELDSAVSVLKSIKRAVIISHYNPDADAYGAALGLGLALKAAGKEIQWVNESGISSRYGFFPSISQIKTDLPSAEEWEHLLVVDCGDAKRVGDSLVGKLKSFKSILNIDHHFTNEGFGTVNLVDTKACSSSEIVYRLLKAAGYKVTPDAATCLLAGVYGDTGSFKYSSTTPVTFDLAKELLANHADLNAIAAGLYGSKPISQLRLEADAISTLELLVGGRVAEVVVTAEMYQRHKATPEDAEHLVELARDIDGVVISVAYKFDQGIWRVSLRSKASKYSVAEIAAKFGGGGHKQASAFRWKKDISELKTLLRAEIENLFKV